MPLLAGSPQRVAVLGTGDSGSVQSGNDASATLCLWSTTLSPSTISAALTAIPTSSQQPISPSPGRRRCCKTCRTATSGRSRRAQPSHSYRRSRSACRCRIPLWHGQRVAVGHIDAVGGWIHAHPRGCAATVEVGEHTVGRAIDHGHGARDEVGDIDVVGGRIHRHAIGVIGQGNKIRGRTDLLCRYRYRYRSLSLSQLTDLTWRSRPGQQMLWHRKAPAAARWACLRVGVVAAARGDAEAPAATRPRWNGCSTT
jgi:hypothetical protein